MEHVSFNFGDVVRHKFSGFRGTVMAKAQYFNGCDRVAVLSPDLHDGSPISYEWFDVQEVELVEEAAEESPAAERTGGPMQNPPRA